MPALFNITVTDISVGVDHTVALTSLFEVYVWGSNSDGQVSDLILKSISYAEIQQIAYLMRLSDKRINIVCIASMVVYFYTDYTKTFWRLDFASIFQNYLHALFHYIRVGQEFC